MALNTAVRIVEARQEHSPFVSWVILEAFRSHLERGFFDYLIGGDDEYLVRYLAALTSTRAQHWAHHSLFLVAEAEDTPVAALSGYFDEEHGGGRLRSAMEEADAAVGRTPDPEAIARALTILNVIPEHTPGAWIIESVATRPEFRRRGLIDALMPAILERGRRRGATVSEISVFIGNDAAQRAYEKHGFEPVAEKRNAEFEAVYGSPGTRTLRRPLT
jgi:GNAT superfamily N-acetyltransferase